ncbi:MAG TPA: hypothetical protein VFX03_08140, partial [Thermomicrobiales bacterium]|nr:hypothetical protein [Thermomicrobiales bacterium]
VGRMRQGSVIVDLAAETGGNCELTVPGEVVQRDGVTIIGYLNLPSLVPVHASQMFAHNIQNLLKLLIGKEGEFAPDYNDEVVSGPEGKGALITRDGEIVHAQSRERLGLVGVAAG